MISFSHISPWSGVKSSHAYNSAVEVDQILTRAKIAQRDWSSLSLDQRKIVLFDSVRRIQSNKEQLARLASIEIGKTILEAEAEVQKCIDSFLWALEACDFILPQNEIISSNYPHTQVSWIPYGVILALMPWNFPFWQITRATVFSLLQGNVVLFKYSEFAPEGSKLWTSCFLNGIVSSVILPVEKISDLIEDSRIDAISFTGSAEVGKQIASICGSVLKHCVLELGGSDVHIVTKSAEIELAASKILKARIQNNGQSCIGAKRILVDEAVKDHFLDRLLKLSKKVKLGDPAEIDTCLSVLVSQKAANNYDDAYKALMKSGAKEVWCSEIIDKPSFFPLRWISLDSSSSEFWQKTEFFCPLGMIDFFKSEEEAIIKANHCRFGLAASVYGEDQSDFSKLVSDLEVGSLVINDYLRSDVRVPFCGRKESGIGVELGREGAREFLRLRVTSAAR